MQSHCPTSSNRGPVGRPRKMNVGRIGTDHPIPSVDGPALVHCPTGISNTYERTMNSTFEALASEQERRNLGLVEISSLSSPDSDCF